MDTVGSRSTGYRIHKIVTNNIFALPLRESGGKINWESISEVKIDVVRAPCFSLCLY